MIKAKKEIKVKKEIAETKVIREIRETKEIREIREIREIKGMRGQTAMCQVRLAYRAFRDPRECLAKKVIKETKAFRVHLVSKAHLVCRGRVYKAFGANKVYRAPQESQAPSGRLAHRVFRARQVPIAVVQCVVVVAQ